MPTCHHLAQIFFVSKDLSVLWLWICNTVFVSLSFHSWTVPAASGAAVPDAQTAAGASPATASQQRHHCQQHTGQRADQLYSSRQWSEFIYLYNIYFLIDPPVIFKSCKLVTLDLLADPGKYIGPGQCSVCRLGPRDRRPTAGSENQGGARTRSQWCPLPLRYNGFPHNHWFDQ